MYATGIPDSTTRRIQDPAAWVAERTGRWDVIPTLAELSRDLVDAFGELPGIQAVAVAVDPQWASLLDPAWCGRTKPCLAAGPGNDDPCWVDLPYDWDQLVALREGSRESVILVRPDLDHRDTVKPWPPEVSEGIDDEAGWLLGLVNVHGRAAFAILLGLDEPVRRELDQVAVLEQMVLSLQSMADLWAEAVALRSQLRRVETEKRTLARLNRMQGRFVAMASHELKTPLTSITAYTDALRQLAETVRLPHAEEFLDVIRTEAGRLLRMVNRILDTSRLEYGYELLDSRIQDLEPLVQETVTSLAPVITGKRQICRVDTEPGLPLVDVDSDLIRQVLVNLIGNAVKYTPEGGHIEVSLRESESGVEVAVADDGPGIPPEDLQRIFSEFYRSRETAESHEGTGLGLTIVRHIINLHGGQIEVSRRAGGGSVFRFVVPKEVKAPHELPAQFVAQSDPGDLVVLIGLLLRLLAESTGFKTVALMLRTDSRKLVPVAVLGTGPQELPAEPVAVSRSWQELLQSSEPQLAAPDQRADVLASLNGACGSAEVLLAPLDCNGGAEACLVLGNPLNPDPASAFLLDQVSVLTQIVSNALRRRGRLDSAEEGSASVPVAKISEAVRALLQIRRSGVPTATPEALKLVAALAAALGQDRLQVRQLQYAAALHDAGMARIEDEIVHGVGELSWDERDEVDRHVEQGVDLMAPLLPQPELVTIIRHHHERVDGSGYPAGLRGEDIPLGSRVLGVIDAWFALTRGRPFRTGLTPAEAVAEIRAHREDQFDADIVDAFIKVLSEEGILPGTPINSGSFGPAV